MSIPKEATGKTEIAPELEDYLAALHEIVAAYHQRLTEVTSSKVANQLLANISDMVTKRLSSGEEPGMGMRVVKDLMGKLGLELETVNVGDYVICKVSCPFASKIHPHLTTPNPVCPISILVLGAMRQTNKTQQITKTTFTETGSEFEVQSVPQQP